MGLRPPRTTMMCLRFGRRFAAVFAPFGLAAFPRVFLLGLLAVCGLSAPPAGASTARSRTRRLTPAFAPLHYTERSFASPHAKSKGKADTRFDGRSSVGKSSGGKSKAGHGGSAGPGRRSAAKGRTAKEAAAGTATGTAGTRSTGTHKAPKHGGKHARDAEFEAPVPMLRVGHGKLGGNGTSGRTKTPGYKRDRRSTDAPLALRALRAPAPAEHRAAFSPTAPLPSVTAAAVPVPAPVAAPTPAPALHIVEGFGSELALAPAAPSDHPGLTRRRNHPSSASALSEDARSSTPAVLAANLPSSLAERDAVTAGAMAPSVLPALSSKLPQNFPQIYDGDGRLVMPAPLRGTREILIHQNTMADNDGLERISNDAELDRLRAAHQLLDLPIGNSLHVNENLPPNRRCARPWTALFTQDIARDFYARFHGPLWVTSAVRTVAFQSRLLRVNGNAAGLSGDFASPHLTGQAIDFGKGGMTAAQIAWMRSYLLPLIQSGKIDVEEEFQQACFHISVYRRYAGGRRVVNEVVQASSRPAPYPPLHQPGQALPRPATVLTNPETTDIDPY